MHNTNKANKDMTDANKGSKEKTFVITPTNGTYDAPSLYVWAEKYEDAVKEAKDRSRLSSFNNWTFK